MTKILTIQEAIDEFELFVLYSDIIETCGEHLEDPSLVSDLYDLIDEHEEEYEFQSDQDGDYSESFEKNVLEAIHIIFEENKDLVLSGGEFPTDFDFSGDADSHYEKNSNGFDEDLEEEEDIDH